MSKNGERERWTWPVETLKLSDAYLEKTDDPMLELAVKMININLPVNHPILYRCRPLYEYSWFIGKIKDYLTGGMGRDEAIVRAMKDCRSEGVLDEFLREHGTEAVNMLYTQFNMEDALEVRGEEKYAEGLEEGRSRGRQEGKCEGRSEGRAEGLIALIRKKNSRGMSAEQIADILELKPDDVEQVLRLMRENGGRTDQQLAELLTAEAGTEKKG